MSHLEIDGPCSMEVGAGMVANFKVKVQIDIFTRERSYIKTDSRNFTENKGIKRFIVYIYEICCHSHGYLVLKKVLLIL